MKNEPDPVATRDDVCLVNQPPDDRHQQPLGRQAKGPESQQHQTQAHNDGDGHTHEHGHGDHCHAGVSDLLSAGQHYRKRLFWAFVVTAIFTVVQGVTALTTDSLALLSDSAHMVTDVLGIGLGLLAVEMTSRIGRTPKRSFGVYRLEVLAALANALLLTGVGVYTVIEAVSRWNNPPAIPALPVLLVAVLGLAANVIAFVLLRPGAQESLNVEGAYLEVVADLLGSVAVIIAAGLMMFTGWGWIDTIVGVGIGLVVVPRALRLGWKALQVLLQTAPANTDTDQLVEDLRSIEGVEDVHDLHVWTLTSGMDVATSHVRASAGASHHQVLDEAKVVFARHGLEHATIQVDPHNHVGCETLAW